MLWSYSSVAPSHQYALALIPCTHKHQKHLIENFHGHGSLSAPYTVPRAIMSLASPGSSRVWNPTRRSWVLTRGSMLNDASFRSLRTWLNTWSCYGIPSCWTASSSWNIVKVSRLGGWMIDRIVIVMSLRITEMHIDGLTQDHGNSIALELGLPQFCVKPLLELVRCMLMA